MDTDLRNLRPEKAEELITTIIVDKVIDIVAMKSIAQAALKIVHGHKKSVLADLSSDQTDEAKDVQKSFMNFMLVSDDKDANRIMYEHSKYMAEDQTLDSLQYICDTMLNKAAVNEHDLMYILHGVKIANLPYDKEAITLAFNKASHNQHEHTWCYINIHLYEDKTDPNSRTIMMDYPLYFFAPDESLPTKAILQKSKSEQDESNTEEPTPKIKINVN